jgi:hypothetical protein
MKNPLILFSELLVATTASISLTEAATLEFCYDHVIEDFSESQQNVALLPQQGEFPLPGIQETE